MRRSRVYIGPANTSNISRNIQNSLREIGIKADFIPWSFEQHSFYEKNKKVFKLFNNTSFKILGKKPLSIINTFILKPFYFFWALCVYDTFIFIKPTTFFRSNSDLPWIKKFNKKIVFLFVGCNDRNPNFSNDPLYVCNICVDKKTQALNTCNDLTAKRNRSLFFEKYASKIFGVADLVDFIKRDTELFRIPMPFKHITDKEYTGKLKILHLPSNPLVKGTSFVKPILQRIAQEENVDIIIKEDIWTREAIIQALKDGHILVDSLAEYTFGKLSLEAIQYGCLPLNAYPDWIAEYYDIPPVVKVNKENLYQTLKELISDRVLLQKYMARSQEAFQKYFTYEAAGQYYKEKLELK